MVGDFGGASFGSPSKERVRRMTVIEVLTLLLVIFAALSYIDDYKKK